ncbi:MAG: atoC [Fibrobacteres bacterium]|nr:atoC [Fibrobacterota bacterium]
MKSIHALLVDDDKAALETMGMILEMDDYLVSTAESGQNALERLEYSEENPPSVDFMVVDLDMNNLSGIELLMEMRKRGHDIPVMVVTGFASKNTVVELLRHGVADFLDKPIHVEEFRIRVHRIANEALRRRKESAAPIAQPTGPAFRAATVLDLGNLGLPYALCRLLDESPRNKLVMACRKRTSFEILLADVRGSDAESFYVSVLIKTFFDKCRSRELGSMEFLRELNQVILAGALRKQDVGAIFIRIHQAGRRLEIMPAGYPTQWFLGLGEAKPRILSFAGSPLGLVPEPGFTSCEVPFNRGDRLFILSEGEPNETILSQGLGPVDKMAENIWRELKPEPGDGREQNAFLLGLELP